MRLSEKKLKELKDNKISIEDLNDRYFIRYFFDPENAIEDENILKLLNENICSFEEIVDKFKSLRNMHNAPSLYRLLENTELFEELRQNNILNNDDLIYLLNTIDDADELDHLCINTSLIKEILNEFILNKELVDRFDTMIKKNYWYKYKNIHTIFDRIEYDYKNNEGLLKLIELNKYAHSFDEDQKLKLVELIKNNEIAQNRLIQIIDNHLESNYDFESLMSCLKKQEKKNTLNI